MVKALLILVALAGAARADTEIDRVAKLGFRIGYGAIPLDTEQAKSTSIALAIEHPVFGRTRAFGEWEWMWLNNWRSSDAGDPMIHGSGQRVVAGLRHAIAVKPIEEMLRIYLDAELGGGAMLATEDRMGSSAVPVGIAGLRFIYDFRNSNSSSRVWEGEFLLRAVVVPTGYGLMFGFGMAWGD